MKRLILCLFSLFLLEREAQPSTLYYIAVFFDETYELIKSPLQWNKRDWIFAFSVLGTTAILFTQDGKIKDLAQQRREEEFDRWLGIGNTFGDGYFAIPFISTSLIFAYTFGSERLKSFGWKSFKSFLLTGSTVLLMKVITNRERPNRADRRAFPSGHSAVAFSLATSISEEFGDNTSISLFVYSLATLTAIARVEYNVHWASDVFFGAVLGIYISRFVHKLEEGRLSLIPYKEGIAISWRF